MITMLTRSGVLQAIVEKERLKTKELVEEAEKIRQYILICFAFFFFCKHEYMYFCPFTALTLHLTGGGGVYVAGTQVLEIHI